MWMQELPNYLITELLVLAMRIDPLVITRGVSEFMTVVYGPAVSFAFPDSNVGTYKKSVQLLILVSVMDGSTLNW